MKDLISFACLLAEKSAKLILPYFHSDIKIETKSDLTPVTIADKSAEELMRNLISDEFPDHGIIGEEFGKTNEDAEYVWILDPIDGTKSFICGVPLFGTLIALSKSKVPILGIINLPAMNQLFVGCENQNTTLNGKEISVGKVSEINKAILSCTDHNDASKHQNGEAYNAFIKNVKMYRNWGDCYMYTLLAQGKIDIAIDPIMNLWDIQALIPIVKGAGGVITDYQGKSPLGANSIIASNPLLHDKVIKLLNP